METVTEIKPEETETTVVVPSAEAPTATVTPAASETTVIPAETVAKVEEKDNDRVMEKDLPAGYTVRHTIESFMASTGADKVESQHVLAFLVRVNEAKIVKQEKLTGIGKGRRPNVYAMPVNPTIPTVS